MRQRYPTLARTGFTLLEILLVLVLVSLASVAVISTLPTSSKDVAKKQAESLFQRILLLNEEAMLSGRDFGLRIDEKKSVYYLMSLESEGWQKLNIDQIPYETKMNESVAVTLNMGGGVWADDERLFKPGSLFDEDMFAEYKEKKKLRPPQVFIVSSGEVTPFSVAIYPEQGDEEQDAWKVVAKENGQIVLLAPGESEDES
ncbi:MULTISPECIES: type II secretion system minor pseudopilin GspH [Vibrio]|uniref:Type II secretion system protein H n=1 Tax=Vibrio neptunius TaxID=170651 RepID=A0ABS3A6V5_9VIBR|nr:MULTISPECIES: type II secretion system minor pseudopilin GspH [Vibrio]KJY82582.1 general secretion pathway protein GspH [Vibrio neptunius]MBN3494792.1 type II secretion system minor pseudopilin GspH [Vibrio neptunius]MBN3517325.1 type II secretion system minor pseudopilin GspH [Vibrio neptunius]MBN3551669.1 type II secretion system minor pseudopilin GspH [Vibrio neptunius]MBN3579735.1 type II secretion system minor pseudopilin GspH [Vibrio neptunius]